MVMRRLTRVLAIDGFIISLALVTIFVFFSLDSQYFFAGENVRNLLVQSLFVLVLSLGMTFVLISGGIDLSVGAVLGLSGGTTLLALQHGAPMPVALLAGFATGTLVGIANGFAITKLAISDFIVTLATLSITAGLLQVLTSHEQLIGVNSTSFAFIGNGQVFKSFFPVPFPVLLVACVIVLLEFVLHRTSFGRSVFAIGINRRAAHLAGMRETQIRFGVYVLSGALAAFGGILLSSRLNSVQPGLGGGYELTAIASAVLGGTSILGGRGSIWRSAVGALFLGTLANGLQLVGVDPVWNTIITGTSIAVAVALDQGVQRLALQYLSHAQFEAPSGSGNVPLLLLGQEVSE